LNVTSYHPPTYRNFDWTTPDLTGIGGSETAVVEIAGRLALRGHDVLVYSPSDHHEPATDPRGARWLDCSHLDTSRPGFWIINRCPQILDRFPAEHPGQTLYFLAEDTFYPSMTEERASKLDAYICLCQSHKAYVEQVYPYLKGRIVVGSNGIRMDAIRELEKDPPKRNPRKLVFASSPDRGLLPLLKIFRRAREWVSGDFDGKGPLELHVFYGFQNLLTGTEDQPEGHPSKIFYRKCMKEMNQPGVVWHDRTSQKELLREWLSAGLFVFPSLFTETNCISVQDAMACGAIPITVPIWAVGEFTAHGVLIHGDPNNDPLTVARFVGELVRVATNEEWQEQCRREMMPYARDRFNWERTIDLFEAWMHGYAHHRMFHCQAGFSLKHTIGFEKILNVGCCDDAAELRDKRGAVNMDLHAVDLSLNRPNAVDVIGDARDLPAPFEEHSFDCVVATEVLEHFETADVPAQLRKFARLLRPGGRIVVTVPDDHRELQGLAENGYTHYADGISFKHHPVSRETIDWWIKEAGLRLVAYQAMEYGFGSDVRGHGFVAEPVVNEPVPLPTTREWAESAECNCSLAENLMSIPGAREVLMDEESGHLAGCPKDVLHRLGKEKNDVAM